MECNFCVVTKSVPYSICALAHLLLLLLLFTPCPLRTLGRIQKTMLVQSVTFELVYDNCNSPYFPVFHGLLPVGHQTRSLLTTSIHRPTPTNTHAQAHMHTCTHTLMHACTHARKRTHTHTHSHTCMHARTQHTQQQQQLHAHPILLYRDIVVVCHSYITVYLYCLMACLWCWYNYVSCTVTTWPCGLFSQHVVVHITVAVVRP